MRIMIDNPGVTGFTGGASVSLPQKAMTCATCRHWYESYGVNYCAKSEDPDSLASARGYAAGEVFPIETKPEYFCPQWQAALEYPIDIVAYPYGDNQ